MLGYLLRRVLAAIPVMGVVALFVFLLLRLTPGDPAAILAGDNATPEQLERIRTSLCLYEPLYQQVLTWMNKLLHGDLFERSRTAALGQSRRGPALERARASDFQPTGRTPDLDRPGTDGG